MNPISFIQVNLLVVTLFPALCMAQSIRLTTLDWPPYIAQELHDYPNKHGYVYDIVAKAIEMAGYEPVIDFFPWARAVENAKSGLYDGVFPEYEVASEDFQLSFPFPGGPVGLGKHKDLKVTYVIDPREPTQNEALKALKQYRFGIVRGYVNTPTFDNAHYLIKEEAVDDAMNIRKVIGKRVDFIFIDQYVAKYILNVDKELKSERHQFEFMLPPLEIKKLYINFSLKSDNIQIKVKAINKALTKMSKSGDIARVIASYGLPIS